MSYALMQQGIVELMCAPGIADRLRPAADARIEDIVRQQVPLVLSRPATDDDVAAVADACGACDGDPRRELGPLTCAALAGSAEFLFR